MHSAHPGERRIGATHWHLDEGSYVIRLTWATVVCSSLHEMVFGVSLAKWTDFHTRFLYSLLAPGFVHRRMNVFPTMPPLHLGMIHFLSQFDRATGCPNISPNIIRVRLRRRFLIRWMLNLGWVERSAFPDVGALHPISWRSEQTKKDNKRELLPESLSLPESHEKDIGLFLPLDLNWDSGFSWVSSLLAFSWSRHH